MCILRTTMVNSEFVSLVIIEFLLFLFTATDHERANAIGHHQFFDNRPSQKFLVPPMRTKRQGENGPAGEQIDLNVTVPYIFSARLYPFGEEHGDAVVVEETTHAIKLKFPLMFLQQTYDTIHIHKNGFVSLQARASGSGVEEEENASMNSQIIAVFWVQQAKGRMFFRESTDPNLLSLARSEVNIQYRNGDAFQPDSIVIVTWVLENAGDEDGTPKEEEKSSQQIMVKSLFQLALVVEKSASFAHFIYSKLDPGSIAIEGFNGVSENGTTVQVELPESGTPAAYQISDRSNIGIPGEWMFRIDQQRIYFCGAGFKGVECIETCDPNQWFLDCSRNCHCAGGTACNMETGECPEGKCNRGWTGSPRCDEDINECSDGSVQCPKELPDCINTPGAYLCVCLEYDNSTNFCKSDKTHQLVSSSVSKEDSILSPPSMVPVMAVPLTPLIVSSSSSKSEQREMLGGSVSSSGESKVPGARVHHRQRPALAAFRNVEKDRKHRPPLSSLDSLEQTASHTPLLNKLKSKEQNEGDELRMLLNNVQNQETSKENSSSLSSQKPPGLPETLKSLITTGGISALVDESCSDRCNQSSNTHCVEGKCRCKDGWHGNPENCEDVDECKYPAACGPHSTCKNSLGSFQCVCDEGFVARAHGCVDFDECINAPELRCPQTNTTTCQNTIGGFECRCRVGYSGDPNSPEGCVDVDECELSEYYCGTHASCINLPGTFNCSCFKGYEKKEGSNVCVDIDECKRTVEPCHKAATCTNLDGSFRCECIEGFVADGLLECRESVLFPISENRSEVVALNDKNFLGGEPIHLDASITVFGKKYDRFYVSKNAILSLDAPINDSSAESAVMDPSMLANSAILVPFHLAFDSTKSGPILVVQKRAKLGLPEEGQNSQGILAKASATIREQFGISNFQAEFVVVVSFEGMVALKNQTSNSFQVAIVQGPGQPGMTFVVFLYATLASPGGLMAITHPAEVISVPEELLLRKSNVGQPGKWIFRVDSPEKVWECPVGQLGPPLCERKCPAGAWGLDCANQCHCAEFTGSSCDPINGFCPETAQGGNCARGFTGQNCSLDLDECLSPELQWKKCHEKALCQNEIGSYSCTCPEGYLGDGYTCSALDPCVLRYGMACVQNASCQIGTNGPECQCNRGFHGEWLKQCVKSEEDQKSNSTKSISTSSFAVSRGSDVTDSGKQNFEQLLPSPPHTTLLSNSQITTTTIISTPIESPISIQKSKTWKKQDGIAFATDFITTSSAPVPQSHQTTKSSPTIKPTTTNAPRASSSFSTSPSIFEELWNSVKNNKKPKTNEKSSTSYSFSRELEQEEDDPLTGTNGAFVTMVVVIAIGVAWIAIIVIFSLIYCVRKYRDSKRSSEYDPRLGGYDWMVADRRCMRGRGFEVENYYAAARD